MRIPNLSTWGFAKRHLREVVSFILLLVWKLFEDRLLGWLNARIDEHTGTLLGSVRVVFDALPFITTGLLASVLLVFVFSTLLDSVQRMRLAVGVAPNRVEVHRFSSKLGRPTMYFQANKTIRLFVPVSIIIVAGSLKSDFLRVGLRLEGWTLLKGWRVLKEDISLSSVNDRQITAWDYRFEISANTASPMQDLVFDYSWPEHSTNGDWPKHARLVLWARITGCGHWERVLGRISVQWTFPQVGEIGFEFENEWDFSGGRTWTSDGSRDQHIWNL